MKNRFLQSSCVALSLLITSYSCGFTTLMKHDPAPIYTEDPYVYLLLASEKNNLFQCGDECCRDVFQFNISPYYQKATRGRDYEKVRSYLGDLEGRWNILGFLYGNTPATGLPKLTENSQIACARKMIYPEFYNGTTNNLTPTVDAPEYRNGKQQINSDPKKEFGYFAAPFKYRKIGVRTEWTISPFRDFGITLQAGITDIKQTLTANEQLINLGCCDAITQECCSQHKSSTIATDCTSIITCRTGLNSAQIDTVYDFLLTDSDVDAILCQQGMDLCDFQKTTVEDVNVRVWFRHPFMVNGEQDPCEWPHFIITPFAAFQATIDVAHRLELRTFAETPTFLPPNDNSTLVCEKLPKTQLLELATGNDGHDAFGFTAGFLLDFENALEIGIEGGFMHFLARDVKNMRIPNSPVQSGVFPFSTDVNVQPGRNYHFKAMLYAPYFLDKLSALVQYILVEHSHDEIRLLKEDPDFLPGQLACLSKFNSQQLLTSLSYDISPNITLGFGVEWPLMQRNSYRTTTVIGTFRGTF